MNLEGYVTVSMRLVQALATFPDLRIQEDGAWIENTPAGEMLVCVVKVWRTPDDPLPVIASASEPIPGRTPYTKNAERMVGFTSALGRALGYMGFGIAASLATSDEVAPRTAERALAPTSSSPPADDEPAEPAEPAPQRSGAAPSAAQWNAIRAIAKKRHIELPDETITKAEASRWIETNG